MPKSCQICRTARFDRIIGCEAYDRLSIAERMYKRSDKCPLIEVPTTHGEWVRYIGEHDSWECSNCGYIKDISEHMNYCPYCGADMRGVDDG